MLFFVSFNLIIPELPDYLSSLGGEDYKGYIISLFTVTAGLSRPFSGKLADTIGRIPVMVFGALVCFFASIMYPFVSSVFAFLLLRFLHGMSTGFKPTGTSAYIADVVPATKRGEAMGIIGLFNSLGMAMGPFLGSKIAAWYGLDVLFYTSATMGILSVIVLAGMKETLPNKQRFKPKQLLIKPKEIFETSVIPPAVTILLTAFSFGIVLTIIPDFSVHIGLSSENKGLFFSVFTISSLAIRFLAGKVSDKYGRISVLKVSSSSLAIAMFFLGTASNPLELTLAAAFFGVAVGMNSPTVFAWTIDLSHDERRGRGMATLYIALEIGIGLGAFLSAEIYNNVAANFKWAFWIGAIAAALAFVYLLYFDYFHSRRKKAPIN